MWTVPGVYAPQDDTWLLAECIAREVGVGARVLDLCTGSGALACAAARAGARGVVAVDLSRRAALIARVNLVRHRCRPDVRRGDLFDVLGAERFDVIVSNPPYVPASTDALPTRGRARAWDAGRDGRAVLDRICAQAPQHLRPGGRILLVQSTVADPSRTAGMLEEQGLEVEVIERRGVEFGPVMRSRSALLHAGAMITAGQDVEDLVVLRATAPR
ncbi:HemK2/MTQ2 family protein methyltransferase [Patulibacter minatonensis]|uniref:HemK2/MTQ2 family protein methyltransferase n=1 Tax=Patulibacter minatonensis TaxID=298163 RepID=UPI00047A40C8